MLTDREVVAAIRKIIAARSRPAAGAESTSGADARDLARYDLIVGLLRRHTAGAEPVADTRARE